MKAKYLRDLLEPDLLKNYTNIEKLLIKKIAYNSRDVDHDTLFVAIRGYKTDGHQYLEHAFKQGAVAAVVEELNPRITLPQILVKNTRLMMAALAARFYSPEINQIRLAGITGTNGKTTTSYLIRSVFEAAGLKSGLIGTIQYVIGDKSISAWNTTPESVDIFRMFYDMIKSDQRGCVLEASSHGLALHRLDQMQFEVAVFTNLSQDHLDFHLDFEDYFNAKKKLFDLLKPGGHAVINRDDQYGRRLIKEIDAPVIDYSAKTDAAVQALQCASSLKGTTIEVKTDQGNVTINSHLIGNFNIENILAAVASGIAMKFDLRTIKRGIEKIQNVPGRLEKLKIQNDDRTIIVDYAHTPDALQKALTVLSPLTEKNLWVVFGCGGDRDKKKRPIMGRIAEEFADRIVITSDNPRSESPAKIIEQILAGIENKDQIVINENRKMAIHLALSRSNPGDTILVAGKGHEDYQEIEGVKYPFDDRQVIREYMA